MRLRSTRSIVTRALLTGALALTVVPACGDDDGNNPTADATNNPTIDASNNTPDSMQATADAATCATDLAPTDDGTGVTADLVMSEISPGNYIELYNSTDSPINLGSVTHQLCHFPSYRALSIEAPQVTVPPKGFALIPWPNNFSDTAAGGEVVLYKDGSFDSQTSLLDFVCWGNAPGTMRKDLAEMIGKWSGACAPALTNGAIHRNMATDGTSAADYDVSSAGSPINCVQP